MLPLVARQETPLRYRFWPRAIAMLVLTFTSACGGCADPTYDGPRNDPDFERPVDDENTPLPCAGIPYYADRDGDGFGAGAPSYKDVCVLEDGESLEDGDCDDSDAQIYPGATERCDWIDRDCNGAPGHLTYRAAERVFTTKDTSRIHATSLSDGGSMAVTWRQSVEGAPRQRFQIVHPDSSTSPDEPIDVTPPRKSPLGHYTITWEPASETFILVEHAPKILGEEVDVFVQRYDLEGNLVEPRRLLLSTDPYSDDFVWSARDGLVAVVWLANPNHTIREADVWHVSWNIDSGEMTAPSKVSLGLGGGDGSVSHVDLLGMVDRPNGEEAEIVIAWWGAGDSERRAGVSILDMRTGAFREKIDDPAPAGFDALFEIDDQVWRFMAPDRVASTAEVMRLDGARWTSMGSFTPDRPLDFDSEFIDVGMHDATSATISVGESSYGGGTYRNTIHDLERQEDGSWSSSERLSYYHAGSQVGEVRFINPRLGGITKDQIWYTSLDDGLAAIALPSTAADIGDATATRLTRAREWLPWEPISTFWDEGAARWRAVFLDSDNSLDPDGPPPEFALVSFGVNAEGSGSEVEIERSTLPFVARRYHAELVDDGVHVYGGPMYVFGDNHGLHEARYVSNASEWREQTARPNPFDACNSGCRRKAPRVFSRDVQRRVTRSDSSRWGQPLEEYVVEVSREQTPDTNERPVLEISRVTNDGLIIEQRHTLPDEISGDSMQESFLIEDHLVLLLEHAWGVTGVYRVSLEEPGFELIGTFDDSLDIDGWVFSNEQTVWWSSEIDDDSVMVYRVDARGDFSARRIEGVIEQSRPARYARLHGLPDGSVILAWSENDRDDPERGGIFWQWLDPEGNPRFDLPKKHRTIPWRNDLASVEWLDGHVIFVEIDGGTVALTAYDGGERAFKVNIPMIEAYSFITPWNNGASLAFMTSRDGVDLLRPSCALE